MELALDFEAYARRPLPPALQSKFVGGKMSLQEKARVLRLIMTILGRDVRRESLLLAAMTNHYRSLITMGAGPMMGLHVLQKSISRIVSLTVHFLH